MEDNRKLIAVIRLGMMTGPSKEVDERIYDHVRDLLAHKFSLSLLKVKDDRELKLLQDLWTSITGEKL